MVEDVGGAPGLLAGAVQGDYGAGLDGRAGL